MMDTVAIQKEKEEKKNRIAGYITSIVIHTLLVLLLLWLALMPPDPPMEYGGIELTMSLGEANMGGPSPVPVETPSQVTPPPTQSQEEEKVATQDVEEAPSIKQQDKTKKKQETKVQPKEEPVEQPRQVDQRALFKKKSADNAGGFGDGNITGNEGSPDGAPGGSPDGNGRGDGLGGTGGGGATGDGWGSYDLAGRSLMRKPNIVDNSSETGKVVVKIIVDRNGRVVKAEPGQKGTNTTSSVLWEKAKQGALEARFSPKPDGPEEQYGTMTIIFKFKP
jgi:outer membrane biosynthesis protein TonB